MKPGSKFSIFLEKCGWRTADLARAMDRPVTTVKSWRTGRRKPQAVETRQRLADVLGISVRQLKRLLD